jgi:hypothetical protein
MNTQLQSLSVSAAAPGGRLALMVVLVGGQAESASTSRRWAGDDLHSQW